MKQHEFYQKYANTPLNHRGVILNFVEEGVTTLHDIYHRLHQIDEVTRPYDIERAHLLDVVETYYIRREEEK